MVDETLCDFFGRLSKLNQRIEETRKYLPHCYSNKGYSCKSGMPGPWFVKRMVIWNCMNSPFNHKLLFCNFRCQYNLFNRYSSQLFVNSISSISNIFRAVLNYKTRSFVCREPQSINIESLEIIFTVPLQFKILKTNLSIAMSKTSSASFRFWQVSLRNIWNRSFKIFSSTDALKYFRSDINKFVNYKKKFFF